MRPEVLRTVYLLGSAETGHLGHVSFAADGALRGQTDPDRARYAFDGGRCYFLNQRNEIRARLRYARDANMFMPDDRNALYLVPLVTLAPPREAAANGRLLVNTIPKSGTYLLELVLREIGYHGLGLHLIPNECHDNRGVPNNVIHRDPFSRRAFAPAAAVASVMAAGEFAVGHVDDADQLRRISDAGVGVINCVRDLRGVLASLFRFKRKSVDPHAPSDRMWRVMPDQEGFLAFLGHYGEGELADIRDFARLMPRAPGVLLRFEDLAAGVIPPGARDALDLLDEGLGIAVEAVLPGCIGRESSTFNAERSDWRSVWSALSEEFFERSGLRAANRALGYEAL